MSKNEASTKRNHKFLVIVTVIFGMQFLFSLVTRKVHAATISSRILTPIGSRSAHCGTINGEIVCVQRAPVQASVRSNQVFALSARKDVPIVGQEQLAKPIQQIVEKVEATNAPLSAAEEVELKINVNAYNEFLEEMAKKHPQDFKTMSKADKTARARLHLERHRIIPAHEGGTYEKDNIVLLSRADHAEAHRLRYESLGSINDKRAANNMLGTGSQSNFADPEWQQQYGGRNAGKKAGQKNVDSGQVAALNADITQNRPEVRSNAGKAAAEVMRDKGLGVHSKQAFVSRAGNLTRHGVRIDGVKYQKDQFTQEFINYHCRVSNQKEYTSAELRALDIECFNDQSMGISSEAERGF